LLPDQPQQIVEASNEIDHNDDEKNTRDHLALPKFNSKNGVTLLTAFPKDDKPMPFLLCGETKIKSPLPRAAIVGCTLWVLSLFYTERRKTPDRSPSTPTRHILIAALRGLTGRKHHKLFAPIIESPAGYQNWNSGHIALPQHIPMASLQQVFIKILAINRAHGR
jgi:hypothetical protein